MPAARRGLLLFPLALFLTAAIRGRAVAQEPLTSTPTETPALLSEPFTETALPPNTETPAPDTPTSEATPSPTQEFTSTPEFLDEPVATPTAFGPVPELAAEQLADIIFGTYGSSFAANVGQAPKDVQFLSQDNGVSFLFTSDAFALLLPQPVFEMSALAAVASAETPTPAFEALDAEIPPPPDPSEAVIVQVSFLGANSGVLAIGQEPLSIQFGMYVGDNPEQLLDRVPLFGLISYPDLYPGMTWDLPLTASSE